MILNFFALIATIQMLFLVHYLQIIFSAFMLGITALNMAVGSIIVNESIDKEYSGLVFGIANAMFPLSGIISTSFMLIFNDWIQFYVTISVLGIALNVLCVLHLRESPRWLYANHLTNDFVDTVLHIASVNGTYKETKAALLEPYSKDFLRKHSFKSISDANENRRHIYDYLDLVRFDSIRMLTLKNIYLWVISGFSFYGLLLNLENLTGNIYLDSYVTYSAEFFSEVFSGYISHKIGRKTTISISFLLATIGCFIFSFVKFMYIDVIFLFIASLGIAAAFNILYIYSNELFPTNIRSLAITMFCLFNRLSASCVPLLLIVLKDVIFIIGVLSFGALFVISTMEESLNTDPGNEVEEIADKAYNDSPDSGSDSFYFNEMCNLSN